MSGRRVSPLPKLLMLLMLLMTTRVRGDQLGGLHEEWVRQVVADLGALAGWCKKKRLALHRDRLAERLLHFDPDHKQARGWLGYTRGKDGSWSRRRAHVEPRNRNPKAEEEYRERWDKLRERLVEAARANLEACGESARPLSRHRLLGDVAVLDPRCGWARKANRETEFEGRWYLDETLVSNVRRMELIEAAGQAFRDLEAPRREQLRSWEREMAVAWSDGWVSPRCRAVGTVPSDELDLALRLSEVAPTLFNSAFGTRAKLPREYGFWLFANKEQGHALLAAHPRLTKEQRERMLARDTSSKWIPETWRFVKWARTREQRLDSVSRQAFAVLIRGELGISTRQGWAWEGIGTYLTYRAVGTRLSNFIHRSGYAEKPDPQTRSVVERMERSDADWLTVAHGLFTGGNRPDLAYVTSLQAGKLGPPEFLASYALAAYLIEGRPRKARAIFRAHAKGVALDEVLRSQLGFGLDTLVLRLPRWLGEAPN